MNNFESPSNETPKNIMVTGGGGFIGRHLIRKLIDSGFHVVGFDFSEQFSINPQFFEPLSKTGRLTLVAGTILDHMHLQHHMRECDTVFHLAAMLGVKRTEENRLACMEINTRGTDIVLNSCALNRINRVIFASSSEVYGEPLTNPVRETAILQGKTVYAVSKLAAEELVKGYNQIFPWLNYTIVRFFNTYGEGQVAQFVLPRFVRMVLEGKNPVVYGEGSQLRSYGHVDDITDGLIQILKTPVTQNQTYNLGNSNEVYRLDELARKVIDTLAPDSDLKVDVLGRFDDSDRSPEREIYFRCCDTSKAARDFGYHPKITVEEGIRRIATYGKISEAWPAAVR